MRHGTRVGLVPNQEHQQKKKEKERAAKKDLLIPFDPFGPGNNAAAMQRNLYGGSPQQQQQQQQPQPVNPFFAPVQANPFGGQGGFNAVSSTGGTGFSPQGNVGYTGQVGVGGVNAYGNLSLSPIAGNNTGFGGNNTGFGGNNTGFGGNNTGFGGNNTGFGGNNTGFGGNNAVNPFQPPAGMGIGGSQPAANPFMVQQQIGGASNPNPFAPSLTQAPANPFLSPSGTNQGFNQTFTPNNSLF